MLFAFIRVHSREFAAEIFFDLPAAIQQQKSKRRSPFSDRHI